MLHFSKKHIALFLLCSTFSVISCQKEKIDGAIPGNLNVPFQLAMADKAFISSEGDKLRIEAVRVHDERCTNCPSPGSAYVRIHVSDMEGALTETTLMIGDCNGHPRLTDHALVRLKEASYRITLQSVIILQGKKKAELLVEKLG